VPLDALGRGDGDVGGREGGGGEDAGLGGEVGTEVERGGVAAAAAEENSREAVIKLLLDRGADVSLENRNGWSAFQLAALNGHEKVETLFMLRKVPEPEDFYGLQKLFS